MKRKLATAGMLSKVDCGVLTLSTEEFCDMFVLSN